MVVVVAVVVAVAMLVDHYSTFLHGLLRLLISQFYPCLGTNVRQSKAEQKPYRHVGLNLYYKDSLQMAPRCRNM